MEERNKTLNINILEVVKIIRKDFKNMIVFIFCGAIIGLTVAFSIPKLYKTTVVLAPEESGSGFMGNISSLAAMVGMDMKIGKTGDAIYPEIYPDVLKSTDFLVGLFDVPVTTMDKSFSSDYATYLQIKTRIPWWEYPKKWLIQIIRTVKSDDNSFKGSRGHKVNPFHLTRDEFEIMEGIGGNISCSVDKKTNVISITVTDQDPFVSASMADTVTVRLQRLITDYRTKKSREDVAYLQGILKEVKGNYAKAQSAYADYTEGHRNAKIESVNQNQAKLKGEMDLAENIYTTISEQLELAKAKVQEKTPAFTTIQNASIPVKHSNSPKFVILILWVCIAIIVRCIFLAWKNKYLFIETD